MRQIPQSDFITLALIVGLGEFVLTSTAFGEALLPEGRSLLAARDK